MDIQKALIVAFSFTALVVQPALAGDADLTPTHSGYIVDESPFDGRGDGIDETVGALVGLNSGIADFRATMEFDLVSLHKHRHVLSAVLQVTPGGLAVLPGTSTIPVQLFSFDGTATIQLEDFNQGSFVAVFEGLVPTGVPINIDVTEAVQRARWTHQRFLGFSMRTNVNGANVTFGSNSVGSSPKLAITYR